MATLSLVSGVSSPRPSPSLYFSKCEPKTPHAYEPACRCLQVATSTDREKVRCGGCAHEELRNASRCCSRHTILPLRCHRFLSMICRHWRRLARAPHRLPVECAARDAYFPHSAADRCFQKWPCTVHLMLCIVDIMSETANALKTSLFPAHSWSQTSLTHEATPR
jgi:hypothetical protein